MCQLFFKQKWATFEENNNNKNLKKDVHLEKCAQLPQCFVVSTQRQPYIQLSKWFLNDTGSAKRQCEGIWLKQVHRQGKRRLFHTNEESPAQGRA